MLPATWTALQKLDPETDTDTKLQMMARWWSSAPSMTTGLNATKGQITEGFDADLVVRYKPQCIWNLTCSGHVTHVRERGMEGAIISKHTVEGLP